MDITSLVLRSGSKKQDHSCVSQLEGSSWPSRPKEENLSKSSSSYGSTKSMEPMASGANHHTSENSAAYFIGLHHPVYMELRKRGQPILVACKRIFMYMIMSIYLNPVQMYKSRRMANKLAHCLTSWLSEHFIANFCGNLVLAQPLALEIEKEF